ncbi:hypothetical protein [Mariniflexile sp.]|uniref:hypothetical protein n=1 Tax=Mariniflexile sp. TaxID=1979402 RepID=UPI0035614314
MITKNYKNIFSCLLALTISIIVVSCDQEENTGYSSLVPTAPNLTVTTTVSNLNLIEDDSSYGFTATLSTVQMVDVKLHVNQIAGDATLGEDYTVDSELVIRAGSLSATGKITILSDDIAEETETVKIQIGDDTTANASITPATMEFTILNYTEGDLAINLEWAIATTTTDNSGVEIEPTDFADMRLLISSSEDVVGDIDEADGAGFEGLVLPSTTPDGTYYVMADFFDVDTSLSRDMNLDINFNQTGVISNEMMAFPNAINSTEFCTYVSTYYIMAEIVKSGSTYTINRVGEKKSKIVADINASIFIGTATAVEDEWADYSPGDTTELLPVLGDPYSFIIDTPSYMTWIANNDTAYMVVTIDPLTLNVTVQANTWFDYGQPGGGGDEYGTGTVNPCTGEITLSITYDLGAWGLYENQTLIFSTQ